MRRACSRGRRPGRAPDPAGVAPTRGRKDVHRESDQRSAGRPPAQDVSLAQPLPAQTKLLNVLFTYALARRLAGTGVTANAVHPANMIRSGGTRELQGAWKVLFGILRPFHASPEEAAREPLRVATDPRLESVTGRFFANGLKRPSAPISHDETLARRVWDESARLVGLPPPPATPSTS